MIASALALLAAVPLGFLALQEVMSANATNAALTSGPLQGFIWQLTPLTLYVIVAVVALGALIAGGALLFSRR